MIIYFFLRVSQYLCILVSVYLCILISIYLFLKESFVIAHDQLCLKRLHGFQYDRYDDKYTCATDQERRYA